ncbi:MAG: hypothetical protein ACC628_10825 [Pirellulaceae bacterium]
MSTERQVADPLRFSVSDVTGRQSLDVENVDGHRTAGDVAMSVASMMELPTNTPFSLRENGGARMLQDDVALGSQVGPETDLTVIPKAHLG